MSINLATATQSELKAYAKNELDLGLSMNMSDETMRDRIVKHCEKLGIELPVAQIQTKQERASSTKTQTMIINIPKSEKPGGAEPVPVGFQGTMYTVPRGINIEVSIAIVEILRNAVQDIVTQDEESGEMYHEDVPAYPFQIIREAA